MTCRSSLLSGRRPDCGESYSHQGWAEDKTASPGRTAESVEDQAGCREPGQDCGDCGRPGRRELAAASI